MLDSTSKKKKPTKIKFQEPLLNTNGIDQAVEGGKFKIKKNKITLSNKELKLELIGSISKKKNKADGKIKTIKLFDDGNLVLTADNYNIKVKDFLKAQKALKDGDFQPLNALLFSGPLVFKGSNGDDQFFGSPKGDKLDGAKGNDTLFGSNGDDTLLGKDGNDFLYAGFDNDWLDGGAGTNTLHGDLGNDYFAFSSINGLSQVLDFGPGDFVGVSRSAFPGIGPKGAIDPDLVEYDVTSPTNPNARFYFTPEKGFYFDENGSGAGGATQIGQFQGLAPGSDFIIVY